MSLSAETRIGSGFAEKIKVAAAVIGILSTIVAVATFIGVKPERRKILEWEYISKTSVINQGTPAAEKIQISYDGRQIKQLTVITARLMNTGAVPIESTDVKDGIYPIVTFVERVIRAEVKEPNRRGIKVDTVFDEHSVQIRQGLLNVGDSIPVEILLEGDPGDIRALPPVLYRIMGIPDPITKYPSPSQNRVGVVYFRVPRPVEYLILIFVSITSAGLLGVGAVGTVQEFARPFPERILAKMANKPAIISIQRGDTHAEKLASALYGKLGSPLDFEARELVRTLPQKPGESNENYTLRALHAVEQQVMPKGFSQRLRLIDKSGVAALITVVIVTISLILVMLGAWHRLIGNY